MVKKHCAAWRMYLTALDNEAQSIIKFHKLEKLKPSNIDDFSTIHDSLSENKDRILKILDGIKIYVNRSNVMTILIVSGVGKVNAAAATSFGISTFNPLEIINIGTCGSLKPIHNEVGRIVRVRSVFQHDAYIPLGGIEFSTMTDKIDLFSSIYEKVVSKDEYEFSHVTLATGDSFIDDEELSKDLSQIADIVDMEGFSIARTCRMHGTRIRIYKMVSDFTNQDSSDIFGESFEIYDKKINDLLERI